MNKTEQRERRHKRIRAKVRGTALRPRLSVFRSSRFFSGQLIDDVAGKTLVAVSTRGAAGKTPVERARNAGAALADQARGQKVERAAFDRGGFAYAGAVRAFAEGARAGGLSF
jgi:large subunit ribosomal protein L18